MAKSAAEKDLQKCTKQELLVLIQGRDAEASERIEALAKAEAKTSQLRTTMVSFIDPHER